MHQSIPAAPSPFPYKPPPTFSQPDPQALAFFFFALDGKFLGVGLKKRGQMACPLSMLQHSSLITQSNRAVSNILMCDFLFQLTSSFVIVL